MKRKGVRHFCANPFELDVQYCHVSYLSVSDSRVRWNTWSRTFLGHPRPECRFLPQSEELAQGIAEHGQGSLNGDDDIMLYFRTNEGASPKVTQRRVPQARLPAGALSKVARPSGPRGQIEAAAAAAGPRRIPRGSICRLWRLSLWRYVSVQKTLGRLSTIYLASFPSLRANSSHPSLVHLPDRSPLFGEGARPLLAIFGGLYPSTQRSA